MLDPAMELKNIKSTSLRSKTNNKCSKRELQTERTKELNKQNYFKRI